MSKIEIKFDKNIMSIRDFETGRVEKTQVTSSKIKSDLKRLLTTGGCAISSHIFVRLATNQKI